jgi:hypothetical protein
MQTLMQSSLATLEFKEAVASFASGQDAGLVKVETRVPRVKVQRLLAQLLAVEPSLEIQDVVVRGMSGCSDFVGTIDVRTKQGAHVFEFAWCCRWRAEHEGYIDYFGFPDQSRAAREFDWQCFQRWERRN